MVNFWIWCRKVCFFFFFLIFIYLFINLWLCWVFVSVRGLSLVAASGGHSSSQCAGLSLSRPLLLRSTGSRRARSVIVAHGPSCSVACGTFPDQGSNPCPLHWQADSQPLRHQGSPVCFLLTFESVPCEKYFYRVIFCLVYLVHILNLSWARQVSCFQNKTKNDSKNFVFETWQVVWRRYDKCSILFYYIKKQRSLIICAKLLETWAFKFCFTLKTLFLKKNSSKTITVKYSKGKLL